MKIAVFDVCGTLYDSNTTFDFLDYYFKDNKRYIIFRKISKLFLIKLLNYPLYKYLNYDVIRYIATYFLKNENYSNVQKEANKFVFNVLDQKIKREIYEILKNYRDKDYQIILMSGSYDFIVEQVASYFAIDNFFASQLEVINNEYTGKYLFDNLFEKKEVLERNYPNILELIVVSDNITDLKLFEISDKSYAVCNKKKQIIFWNKQNIKNMELIK